MLPSTFVLPRYDGSSIANIASTISWQFGIDYSWPCPKLDDDLLTHSASRSRLVVLVLVDGLSWTAFHQESDFAKQLNKNGARVAAITSVLPTTTTTCTTSLWTGAAPSQHGIIGTVCRIENDLIDVLAWRKISPPEPFRPPPAGFLGLPTLDSVLNHHSVDVVCLLPHDIIESPLSLLQTSAARRVPYYTTLDFWGQLSLLSNNCSTKRFVYAYFPHIDNESHRDGPFSEVPKSEWHHFAARFLEWGSSVPPGATIMLTADHGHTTVDQSASLFLPDAPQLIEQLRGFPWGDRRHTFVFASPIFPNVLRDSVCGENFAIMSADQAIATRLYGPETPTLAEKIGDFVLLAKEDSCVHHDRRQLNYRGMHAGIEKDEMLVPWVNWVR